MAFFYIYLTTLFGLCKIKKNCKVSPLFFRSVLFHPLMLPNPIRFGELKTFAFDKSHDHNIERICWLFKATILGARKFIHRKKGRNEGHICMVGKTKRSLLTIIMILLLWYYPKASVLSACCLFKGLGNVDPTHWISAKMAGWRWLWVILVF